MGHTSTLAEAIAVLEQHHVPVGRYNRIVELFQPRGGKLHRVNCTKASRANAEHLLTRESQIGSDDLGACCRRDPNHSQTRATIMLASHVAVLDIPDATTSTIDAARRAIHNEVSTLRWAANTADSGSDIHTVIERLDRIVDQLDQRADHYQFGEPTRSIATAVCTPSLVESARHIVAVRHSFASSWPIQQAFSYSGWKPGHRTFDGPAASWRDALTKELLSAHDPLLRALRLIEDLDTGVQFRERWGTLLDQLTSQPGKLAGQLKAFNQAVLESFAEELADVICQLIDEAVNRIWHSDADVCVITVPHGARDTIDMRSFDSIVRGRWGHVAGERVTVWNVPRELGGVIHEREGLSVEIVDSGPLSDTQLADIVELADTQPDMFDTLSEYVNVGTLI